MAGQKAAFLALPEATRKAAQDALVWLGFYNGVADGDFGKRTRDAILRLPGEHKSARRRRAVGGRAQGAARRRGERARRGRLPRPQDPKTGAKIGAPTKLFAARERGQARIRIERRPRLGRPRRAPVGRDADPKVAYKAMKPDDFFVVSGQEGPQKFYTRFEKNEAANPPIRGFTFTYPATGGRRVDRIAIAIANSFEAFPAPGGPVKAPGASAAAAPEAPGSSSIPPAASPEPSATALIVAPGEALTALKPRTARTRPSAASPSGSSARTPRQASR